MVVTCDNCRTKFKLDDSKITDKGIKVRCSKCQAVFLVKKPAEDYSMAPDEIKKAIDEALGAAPPKPRAPEAGSISEDIGFSESLHAEAKEKKGEEWGEITFSEKPETGGSGEDMAVSGGGASAGAELDFGNVDIRGAAEEKIDFGGEEEPPKREKPPVSVPGDEEAAPVPRAGSVSGGVQLERKIPPPLQPQRQEVALSKLLTMIILLGVLGGGGLMYLRGSLSLSGFTQIFSSGETKKTGEIAAFDVKGNYFSNIRGQQIFIIEGKVTNKFDTPRSFIKIRGILYDTGGSEVLSREVYGGWSFSEDELRNLSSKEIDDKLNNKMGDSLSNFNVPPGATLPFMVVFYDVPGTISSFSAVVAESQGAVQ